MANETINFYRTKVQLNSNGGAITNNAVGYAGSYNLSTQGGNYPDGEFTLTCTFSVAPVEGTVVALYAQGMNVEPGSVNEQVPEAGRPTQYIGSFVLNNVTTTQAMVLKGFDLPKDAAYYLHNSGSGQTLPAGWGLSVVPKTVGPAA